MKIQLPNYSLLLTKIINILIFVLSTAQACDLTATFYKSMLNQDSVFVKNSVWEVNGTAKVYVTPGNLQCDDYCSFVSQNLTSIWKCNISRDSSNNSTYNVQWVTLPSDGNKPQLNIKCEVIDKNPDNYNKQKSYTFVFNNTNSSQTCNTSLTSNITRNSSNADTFALYSFNLSTPSLQMYPQELKLSIDYLLPVSENINVTYMTTKNQTLIENIKLLNLSQNQSTFLVTNNTSIRSYIKNIMFDIVYQHPKNSSQQKMTIGLKYQQDFTAATDNLGQKQFNITQPSANPANLSYSTFDLQSIYNNSLKSSNFPIKIRPNQPFSVDFNVTVNRSICHQYNNTECWNLFDTMIVQLEGLNFSSSGSVTIISNQSKQLKFAPQTQYNPIIKIIIGNVSLTEGLNKVFINGVQNVASTSLPKVGVKCYKSNKQIKQLYFSLQINQSDTYVQQSILYINQLNGSYPSRLNQPQQFDLNITLGTPLTTGDYVVINIPSQYTFMKTNPIEQTDNISLCSANTNYKCFNGQNNTYQIWVTGQFNNITSLIVSIDNNTYRSPRTWRLIQPFYVKTLFSARNNKDVWGNVTKNKTFYLHCNDLQKKCRDCDSAGNCLSCYDANDTIVSQPYPYLNQGSCVSNCSTNCLTCSVYTSNCTSCQTSYSLYSENKANFSCISPCPSSFVSINSVCKPCAVVGCLSCTQNQSKCQSCNANYSLSSLDNKCYAQCPSAYFSQLSQGSLICASCSQGCKTCTNSTYCQNCSTDYFQQLYTANNSNICVKNCSAGRVFLNNNCNTLANQSSKNNSSNTTNQNSTHQSKSINESTTVSSQSSSFKILTALPCTFLLLLSIIVAGGSKLIVPLTNIFHLFTSASGVLQVVSWYLALSIFLANSSESQTDFSQNAKIIISSALSLNFIINLIGFYFFKTNFFGDDIFYRHYFCLKNSMSARFYVFTTLMFIFMLTSNKIIEIFFSNLFGIKCFSFRLQNYSQILRHNYLRYASLIPSLVALVASIMTMLSLKSISLNNNNLLTLIDLCIVTIWGMAATIKIVFRNQSDYQIQQRADVIDINEQISNQPISDLHNNQQVKKSKHQTPSKSKSPIKAIILHCSRKKAEMAQSRHQTQQHLKPYPERQIVCTDDHFQEKDIDEHSNQLNETRVTTKVYISKPKKALKEGSQSLDYRQNNLQTKLTKIRSNRRQQQKVIKQFIGDENENLKHQIRTAFLPDQIKIMKQILNTNELYQKVVTPQQKILQRESQANLNNQNAPSTADKLHLLAKFKPPDHQQLERETQLAIQQLDLAVDLMAYKNISLQKIFKYFELLQREESECQKENFCSNLSTPYVNNYFNNEVVLSKGSRNSRQTRIKTKKRRSQFRDGPKIFLENQNRDLSPYVADFYVHQEAQNDNCQLQKEEIDEQGNIDAAHCRQINQQPTSLMKIKPFSSLDNTAGSEIYVDYKKPNNENMDCVSKSQQIEASRPLTLNKIGSSVPLKKKIQADCGIPESCELDEDNIDYLQTDRYGDTQMKLQELEEQNEHFQHNFVNRMQAEINDRTPGKPKMEIIKSRILCGSQEITNQFKDAQQVSTIMSRYGARQLLTMNKKRLPSLGREGDGVGS